MMKATHGQTAIVNIVVKKKKSKILIINLQNQFKNLLKKVHLRIQLLKK